MATGTLTSTTIAARYKSLLKITGTANDVLHATTLKLIEDGDGNDSPLYLAQQKVKILSATDSTTMFQILDADGGVPIFNVDSTNERIGIGTATPQNHLTVYHATTPIIQLANSTSGVASSGDGLKIQYYEDDTSIINQETNGLMHFGCADSIDMTILASGNVGIGTSSPTSAKLTVTTILDGDYGLYVSNTTDGSAAEACGRFYSNSADNGVNVLQVIQDMATDDVAYCVYFKNDGDGGVLSIENTGTGDSINDDSGAKLTAVGVFTDASDINRKNTIIDNPYGLDIVNKLKARKFKWNLDNSDDLGFISQEVEEFLPEIVDGEDAKEEDYEVDAAHDGKPAVMGRKLKGGKTLNYNGIVSVLVNAVQELSAKVEALENA